MLGSSRRGKKGDISTCNDVSGIIFTSELFKDIQEAILLIPLLQDTVKIQSGFFHHIYHIGCAFNLHSIINNGLIPGGQNSIKRQTVFFLPIDPGDKEHKDPEKIDLNVPRRAQYLHNAWKKQSRRGIFGLILILRFGKGLTFDQTRSNAIILQGILPAYCTPKVVRLKIGEVLNEKAYMSPRPPPKISPRHDWTKELSSKVARQPEGEVARQAKLFQSTQPIPKPICDRSGQPDNTQAVFLVKGETSRSQEISVKSFHEELCSLDRSGQPDITQDVISVQTCSSEDNKSLNVEQTHDRSGQPDKHTVAIQDDPEVFHETETLNTDNETIRERIEEDHGLQNSRTTTFYCEATAECQRSRIDSENREPPAQTCSSTRPATKSII